MRRRYRDDSVPWGAFELLVDQLNVELERIWRHLRDLERRIERDEQRQRNTATEIILTIGGTMPGQINVDTDNETATVGFVDDKKNPTTAPDGAEFAFASDDESVATVEVDADNPNQADITPVGLGTANISVTSNGTAVDGDGVAIPDPDPVQVTVGPGRAAGESFILSV